MEWFALTHTTAWRCNSNVVARLLDEPAMLNTVKNASRNVARAVGPVLFCLLATNEMQRQTRVCLPTYGTTASGGTHFLPACT